MNARQSMVNHSSLFKYNKPVVSSSSKRFTPNRLSLCNQENIAPPCLYESTAKKRKLLNGQAQPVSVTAPVSSESKMDISPAGTPTRVEMRNSFMFTPPQKPNQNGTFAGSFSKPRASEMRPKSTQDVFRNVILYIEVKTIDEDRSETIKAVAKQMGATVNDKLYKNTTHVIFREGSMTTYKKAIKMGVPLVSVSWLEECRKTLSLVDPARFLPINLEPYEKPELYKRVRKAAPTNGEVATTPERFALKPLRPEEELERALIEFQQTRLRLEMDSPTPSSPASNLSRTALNFSPFGESTKIGAPPKTPNASNVTPLLRRLMIRNAEEDRRERNYFIAGKSADCPLPTVDSTKYERMSMDLSSMWGTDEPEDQNAQDTINESVTMVEDTVDLTENSPNPQRETNSTEKTAAIEPNSKTTSIIQALRRQTMIFTQNASLDISPQAVKENVVAIVRKSHSSPVVVLDDSVEEVVVESGLKVPKICATSKKSMEEDTLRDDILRAKEELLNRAVVINKSDKRRSLLPTCMSSAGGAETEKSSTLSTAVNKVNRRRTLFNVNEISEGGLTTPPAQKGNAKQATKRKTLLPTNSGGGNGTAARQLLVGSPVAVKEKKPKNSMNPPPAPAPPANKPKQSIGNAVVKSKTMGPPAKIPGVAVGKGKVAVNKLLAPTGPKIVVGGGGGLGGKPSTAAGDGTTKRKLFNSIAELSPVSSQVRSPIAVSRVSTTKQKPTGMEEKGTQMAAADQPVKKCRRSSLDFEDSSTTLGNSSTATTARSSAMSDAVDNATTKRQQSNVIVLTNGHGKQLDHLKEVVRRLGGNYEVGTRVTSKTTHLVCYNRKRNMNMLRCVIRGTWILDFDWVVQSDTLGKWQREEQFEVPTFGNTLTRVRSERQAFGANYKMEVFAGTGKYYVYETATVPVHHLKELIMLGGGIVVDTPEEAKYLVADKVQPDVQVISPSWIFECVCQYAFLNHKKYLKK